MHSLPLPSSGVLINGNSRRPLVTAFRGENPLTTMSMSDVSTNPSIVESTIFPAGTGECAIGPMKRQSFVETVSSSANSSAVSSRFHARAASSSRAHQTSFSRTISTESRNESGWCTSAAADWMARRDNMPRGVPPPVSMAAAGPKPSLRSSSVPLSAPAGHPTDSGLVAQQVHNQRTTVSDKLGLPDSTPTITRNMGYALPRSADLLEARSSDRQVSVSDASPTISISSSCVHFRDSCVAEGDADSIPPVVRSTQQHVRTEDSRRRVRMERRQNESKILQPRPHLLRPEDSHDQSHILDVILEEVAVSTVAPGVDVSWFETASCFVSLHPKSAPLSHNVDAASGLPIVGRLPKGVPSKTEDGCHLVSQALSLEKKTTTDHDEPMLLAQPGELMSMRFGESCDHGIVCLWWRKRLLFNEEVRLLGCRVVPLRDESLDSRLVAWDVLHVETGDQIAVVRLRTTVAKAPGPIQLPHLDSVESTSVELKWSVPLTDNGRPIVGYRVEILTPCTSEWVLLTEGCNSTGYLIKQLNPRTTYMLDIRAVNEVGIGEHCTLEVETATAGEDIHCEFEEHIGGRPEFNEEEGHPMSRVQTVRVMSFGGSFFATCGRYRDGGQIANDTSPCAESAYLPASPNVKNMLPSWGLPATR
eukprot:TRINITY_DN62781_c0_g1_i1.p1 TRINITY_DN62781_c0_g1~~TRINITY_DN62781_c0_g1_i1.p1  ORF type:complete len:680 (+),score=76.00 TRINITY_DN62781_c0_g1_i1:102-2042(+)